MPRPDPATTQPAIDRVLSATGPVSPAVVVALVAQPVLTALLALFQGAIHAIDWLAPPGAETIELGVGALVLLVSILAHGYTVVFVAAYVYDVRAGDVRRPRSYLLAVVATTAQGLFLLLPIYRVYGPSTFEEVLFGVSDLLPLVGAALATLLYLGVRTGRLAPGPDT